MIKRADVEAGLRDAFLDALKERFKGIAANEITQGVQYERGAFRITFENLKLAYDDAMQIAGEVFPSAPEG